VALSAVVLAVSAVARVQVVRGFLTTSPAKDDDGGSRDSRMAQATIEPRSSWRRHVDSHGGFIIFSFKFARLAFVLVLFVLYAVSFVQRAGGIQDAGRMGAMIFGLRSGGVKRREWIDAALCVTYVRLACSFPFDCLSFPQAYAFVLATASTYAKRSASREASAHLTILLLLGCGVYAYRDIWPLMTFTLTPADVHEGGVIWAKMALLFVSGVVIPLIVPRQYVPLDPRVSSLCRSHYVRPHL
jgi:hypothetical protein